MKKNGYKNETCTAMWRDTIHTCTYCRIGVRVNINENREKLIFWTFGFGRWFHGKFEKNLSLAFGYLKSVGWIRSKFDLTGRMLTLYYWQYFLADCPRNHALLLNFISCKSTGHILPNFNIFYFGTDSQKCSTSERSIDALLNGV